MKTKTIAFLAIAAVVMSVAAMGAVMAAKKDGCTTIQDGTLLTSDGRVITTGYDEWGYNYQAHMFNGYYCDSYRDASWCQLWKDVELMMKWNDAWLSNKDCDEDKLLDRHYGYESYIGSGAWLTNHQWGSYNENSIVDEVNIGLLSSEVGHNLAGWSDLWTWGGNYGGGDDGTLRLLMGPGDGCGDGYQDAYFTMDTQGAVADKLLLRHLDGSQDDNFDVCVLDVDEYGEQYTLIGRYESQGGGENWVTTEYTFSPRSGEIKFMLVATGTVTGWCSNWGQVAFSWAQIEGTCYWNYFVKIVAVPSDATLEDGIWYTADGTVIGYVIWGKFAVIEELENDPCAGVHGIQYKPASPGLGCYKP